MKLTTPLQKNLICLLLGVVVGTVTTGLFFGEKISALRKQQASENTSQDDEIASMKVSKEVDMAQLARRSALRELPAHIDGLLENLSDWGYWAPGAISVKGGQFHMDSARYKGTNPSKHSYERLESVGALENDTQGYITLYMVLATEADKERGRKSGGGIDISVEANNSSLNSGSGDLEAVFATSDAAQQTLVQLQKLQGILITHRDDLIAEGYLAK